MHNFILFAAAFFAGILNAIAGGGSFLTIPALIAVGLPPISAGTTSTTVMLPGALATAYGFRQNIYIALKKSQIKFILGVCLIGALCGTILLIYTPNKFYLSLMPWLILSTTLIFAYGPKIAKRYQHLLQHNKIQISIFLLISTLLGGYFSGCLGILLLCSFYLLGYADIYMMNALKILITCVVNILSFCIFTASGLVAWHAAMIMTIAIVLGGFIGAKIALYLPAFMLRYIVIAIGLSIASGFLLQNLLS